MKNDKKIKIKRVPLHQQNVFKAEAREGYKRYWVNELPGEVDRYILAGWDIVLQQGFESHDDMSQVESQMDSVVRRIVNKGMDAPCRTAVLMEIPIEHYEADQAAEQAEITRVEKTFDPTSEMTNRNFYGGVSISYNK